MNTTAPETPAGYHRHPNGGGLVKNNVKVDANIYIGPNERIEDLDCYGLYALMKRKSVLMPNARIEVGALYRATSSQAPAVSRRPVMFYTAAQTGMR